LDEASLRACLAAICHARMHHHRVVGQWEESLDNTAVSQDKYGVAHARTLNASASPMQHSYFLTERILAWLHSQMHTSFYHTSASSILIRCLQSGNLSNPLYMEGDAMSCAEWNSPDGMGIGLVLCWMVRFLSQSLVYIRSDDLSTTERLDPLIAH
jgi:hypothetical protein